MRLNFSTLQNALQQLEKSLAYAHSEMAKNDAGLFEQLRNSVIQCFEFTYELSHKMLKRYLEAVAANPEAISEMSFQELIREGNQKGLLQSDWSVWKGYRQARNNSSHTYDAQKAQEVFEVAPAFLAEVRFLLAQLMQRTSKNDEHA